MHQTFKATELLAESAILIMASKPCGEQAKECVDLFHERHGRDAVLGVRCWEGCRPRRPLRMRRCMAKPFLKRAWLDGRSDSETLSLPLCIQMDQYALQAARGHKVTGRCSSERRIARHRPGSRTTLRFGRSSTTYSGRAANIFHFAGT